MLKPHRLIAVGIMVTSLFVLLFSNINNIIIEIFGVILNLLHLLSEEHFKQIVSIIVQNTAEPLNSDCCVDPRAHGSPVLPSELI